MLKRIKTLFNTISEIIQVFLYFYAFFAIVVWFLYLSHCPLGETLNYYFVFFENIVNKFYTPNEVNWTLVWVALLCIVVSYILLSLKPNPNALKSSTLAFDNCSGVGNV